MAEEVTEALVFLFLLFYYFIPSSAYIYAVVTTPPSLKRTMSPNLASEEGEKFEKTIYKDGHAKTILVRSAMMQSDHDEELHGLSGSHSSVGIGGGSGSMKPRKASSTGSKFHHFHSYASPHSHHPYWGKTKGGLRQNRFHDSTSSLGSVLTKGQFTPTLLTFSNLTYSISTVKYQGIKRVPSRVTILHGVSGTMKPGSLCAIMGPSGCGKSTLLDILAQRKYIGDIRGLISINGVPLSEKETFRKFKKLSAYVKQNDTLFSNLSVKEILLYAAEFRIPEYLGTKIKFERVEKVLEDLDLTRCANTRIGIEGGGGLSRGQKRRVSVATELITSPSILFLDEPTSGLDAYSSLKLIKLLKKLAVKGRTVICTIHQPREDIFRLFDSLLLMVSGHVAYSGPLSNLTSYFNSIGREIPVKKNPADLIADLTHDYDDENLEEDTLSVVDIENLEPPKMLAQSFTGRGRASFLAAFAVNQTQQSPNDTEKKIKSNDNNNIQLPVAAIRSDQADEVTSDDTLVDAYKKSLICFENTRELHMIEQGTHPLLKSIKELIENNEENHPSMENVDSRYSNSLTKQVMTLLQRAHINNFRSIAHWVSWVLGGLSFLFYGLIYVQLLDNQTVGLPRMTQAYWDNQRALFYQLLAAVVFLQLSMITAGFQEKRLFYDEHSSNAYSTLAYHINWYIRIMFSGFVRGLTFPLLFYFITGLSQSPSSYFVFISVFSLVDCIAGSLSLFLVAILPTLDNASSAFTIFTNFVGTTSGFFLRPTLIPTWFIWGYYLSFLKYALEALYENEYQDYPDILVNVFEVDTTFNKWGNIMMLVLFNIFFTACSFLSSYWKTKTKEAKEHKIV